MAILIIRPLAEAGETAKKLEQRGHKALIAPVMTITPCPWHPPEWDAVSAVIITSGNAVEALKRGVAPAAALWQKPLYVVGERTAMLAKACGFKQLMGVALQSAQLAEMVQEKPPPSGKSIVHLTSPHRHDRFYQPLAAAGYRIEPCVVYHAQAVRHFAPAIDTALAQGQVTAVLFYSARSAMLFQHMMATKPLPPLAVCISPPVAAACAAYPWQTITTAATPTEAAMLACLEIG